MRRKRALITGISGQDGAYLSAFLIDKGYDVYGLVRRSSSDPLYRIESLTPPPKIKILYGDLRDSASLERAIKAAQPSEIYNLAAQSDVGISFKVPEETMEINYYGVGRLVNEAMRYDPGIRIYQASTSEMFGNGSPPPQNEHSPFEPVSPYAEAKYKAHEDFVKHYRHHYGLFICSGILFNHESPLRGTHFVTRKITRSLVKIKLGLQTDFELGNLYAKRDWGFAGDYVEAMWLMLQQSKPEDFVIATGQSRSVKDFVNSAAQALNMQISWSGRGVREVGKDTKTGKIIVRVHKKFYRPSEVNYLCGDSTKAYKKMRWRPKTSFDELVQMMVDADLSLSKSVGHMKNGKPEDKIE
jgi:GDPmannose 4,6-dehydratase